MDVAILEEILANQKKILEGLLTNQQKIMESLAIPAANKDCLCQVLANQEKILANQEKLLAKN